MTKNIAILSASKENVTETFVQNHKNNVIGNVFYYYNGFIPKNLDGHGNLAKTQQYTTWNRFKKKLGLPISSISSSVALKKSLQENKICGVIAEFGNVGASNIEIIKELNLPMITFWYGYEISMRDTIMQFENQYRQLLQYANNTNMVVSRTMIKPLIELGAKESSIIYNPCPPSELFFDCAPSFDNNNILAIGRFVDKKAPYYLVLSMIEVIKEIPDAVLNLVGDGPLFDSVKNLINHYQLNDNIRLIGPKTPQEIKQLVNQSSIFVQHSITSLNGDSEGTPVAIMEASAAGLPVVSTFHSGIPDVIIDKETGLLVQEHDANSFAKHIVSLLKNKYIAKEMGQKGRANMQSNFRNELHLQKVNDFFCK